MAVPRLFTSPVFRFSIRQLLLGTALVAVACVALRSASPTWVASLFGVMLLVLTAAVPLAIFRAGADRAWWFGFGLFGWLYILLLAYGWSLDPNAQPNSPLRPHSLITSRLSTLGHEKIYGVGNQTVSYQQMVQQVATTSYVASGGPGMNPYAGPTSTIPVVNFVPVTYTAVVNTPSGGPALDDFVNVAHGFWGLLVAVCGGWFTGWLYGRSATQQPIAAESDKDRTTK